MSNTTKKSPTNNSKKSNFNSSNLKVIGAKENNLKDISLEVPHDELTIITGLSGSGKSSLAFDTIYAEGQRRYIETFSPYTRQFFEKVKKPNVDKLENIRPAIAIEQKNKVTGSRSTVGTLTNINDYIKILWPILSSPYCPHTGKKLIAWNSTLIIEEIKKFLKDLQIQTVLICAEYNVNIKYIQAEIDRLGTLGYSRIWDRKFNQPINLEEFNFKNLNKKNNKILLIIERLKNISSINALTKRSIEQAFLLGSGIVTLVLQKSEATEYKDYYKDFRNDVTSQIIEKPKSYIFSYNHPLGACPTCKGFGHILTINSTKVIPDVSKSISENAIACWAGPSTEWEFNSLIEFCQKEKISCKLPWASLSENAKEKIFNHKDKDFWGINHWFKWLEKKTYKMHVRVFLSRYRQQNICPDCNGSRLKKDALLFLIDDKNIAQVFSTPVSDLLPWFIKLQNQVSSNAFLYPSVNQPLKSIINRLNYLNNLGLGYLTLDRQAKTLSGGETQRVNLTTALGSNLVNTQFVLDEPSVGLHPYDSENLLKSIKDLTSVGNSVLVVEHDPEVITSAENIIELGPKAGKDGGQIIYNGKSDNWPGTKVNARLRPINQINAKSKFITITKASARNLKNINIKFPINQLTCLTGLSGSGKSTLATEVLEMAFKLYKREIEGCTNFESFSGFEHISDLVFVDQSSLSKTPRATIGTYTKIWDAVRQLFASTPEAIEHGFSKSTFSFNVAGGRCPDCEGAGFIKENMQFLSDILIPCENCLQKRFLPKILSIDYEGKNISDFLDMTVDQAFEFFKDKNKEVINSLDLLKTLGLGGLTLGHPLSELSGGEAQRLKLIPYLQLKSSKKVFFIFDEPTTGLHVKDVENLILLFDKIINDGHTVMCIEHNLSVIQNADWIVDLGPKGGLDGGKLMYCGQLKDISSLTKKNTSLTLEFLASYQKKIDKGFVCDRNQKIKKIIQKDLIITGAKEHNLKNISFRLPSDKLIAITGVSGSGKSTVAKDIIYAEGQRRYLDCLSPYARQFIKELSKPDIENISNVRPTICVYQHTYQPSELSTVATMSEVYNFLRLLYAKIGVLYCPDHPTIAIKHADSLEICQQILNLKSESIRILSPVIKEKKGTHKAIFERAVNNEILEVRVDGYLAKSSYFLEESLSKTKPHTIEYVIAKFNPKRINKDILKETIDNALIIGAGSVLVLLEDGQEKLYSTKKACSECQRGFLKIDPEDLSFNSKRGRCSTCEGSGIIKNFTCHDCQGTRLQEIARNLRIEDLNIFEACNQTASELFNFLKKIKTNHSGKKELIYPILEELQDRLVTLIELGLDYLNLTRSCKTLSGGELQRLRIASAIGTKLSGVCYIFDEPSAGLHPKDNKLVLNKLKKLKDNNNTVIIIEHDVESILSCDHILDIGPHAGVHGGKVVYNGDINKYKGKPTPTSIAISNKFTSTYNPRTIKDWLTLKNATLNNIINLNIKIPLRSLVTIGGVSGAGKSTLVHGLIINTLTFSDKKSLEYTTPFAQIFTSLAIDKIIYLDQKPIGQTSRSTPASYLRIWDEIRKIFASTIEAKSQGWTAGYFSYNSGNGRCPDCKGSGVITLEMNFLASAKVVCQACQGSRYKDDIEIVRYQGKSISEVLELTFEEAKDIFVNHRKIHPILNLACELGLGYLKLGQASNTLSGGEAQRIKIVSELSSSIKGHTLYVLDEPTLGLHRLDTQKLIKALHRLVDQGASVIIIEHDTDVIVNSDYYIELGPGAGQKGGKILYAGQNQGVILDAV